MLASRAIAYLNVDSGVHGPGFFASATPQLDELLKQATQQVRRNIIDMLTLLVHMIMG